MAEKKKVSISEKILSNKFYPIIILSVIVFVAVFLLMMVNNITHEKILLEREAKVTSALQKIFSDMQDFELKDDIYIIIKDNKTIGYAFNAIGKGYGGEINTMVGLNPDFTIKGISIVSNSETPGLGTKILESFFTDQFQGLSSQDIKLSKDGGKIDAISGATISSRAVTDSVKKTVDEKIEIIKAKGY